MDESGFAVSSSPGGAGTVHAAAPGDRGWACAVKVPNPREPRTSKAANATASAANAEPERDNGKEGEPGAAQK